MSICKTIIERLGGEIAVSSEVGTGTTFTFWLPSVVNLNALPISSENAIGMNDFDYYPPEMAQQKRKEDMEIAATGKGMHWIMEGKDKNGNLLILDKQKIMVESEDFSPIIVSIEWDITQLELMRRELIE